MICKDCAYFWQDDEDEFPCCHYQGPTNWAPCEQDPALSPERFKEDEERW